MFSGGTSNTMASLYTGFRVFLFVDVFLFFNLRPSHISETFTYGSIKKWHKQEKLTWFTFGIPVGCCSYSQYQILITRCTSDIHGLEVASLYHGNGQSARSRQVTKWKHQIPKVHIILKDTKIFTLKWVWLCIILVIYLQCTTFLQILFSVILLQLKPPIFHPAQRLQFSCCSLIASA